MANDLWGVFFDDNDNSDDNVDIVFADDVLVGLVVPKQEHLLTMFALADRTTFRNMVEETATAT